MSSPPVQALLEVLADLEPADQRRFLRFVTGCPRLPPGGVAALQPRLTVVRKHPTGALGGGGGASAPEGGGGGEAGLMAMLADGDLPSVMTCANYIKLPPYSSKVVLKVGLGGRGCGGGEGSWEGEDPGALGECAFRHPSV